MPIDLYDRFHRHLVVWLVLGGARDDARGMVVGCALTAWHTEHLKEKGYLE